MGRFPIFERDTPPVVVEFVHKSGSAREYTTRMVTPSRNAFVHAPKIIGRFNFFFFLDEIIDSWILWNFVLLGLEKFKRVARYNMSGIRMFD